jgi:hypothetical protein
MLGRRPEPGLESGAALVPVIPALANVHGEFLALFSTFSD